MRNKITALLISSLILLVCVPCVLSIGISPPMVDIIFKPNITADIETKIIGESQPFDANVIIIGELKDYIEILSDKITVPAGGMVLKSKIHLPSEMAQGKHVGTLIIEKTYPETKLGEGRANFGVKIAIGQTIAVHVTDNTKYAEVKLVVPNVNVGRNVDFVAQVANFGGVDLFSVKGTITVFNKNNEKIIAVNTSEVPLMRGEKTELYAHWTPENIQAGRYKAVIQLFYDSKETTATTEFFIGDIIMELGNMTPSNFTKAKLQKFEIQVQNFWSENLTAFADVHVLQNGTEREKITTPPLTVTPFGSGVVSSFWDTEKYDPGIYTFKAVLKYQNRTAEKTYEVSLIKAPIPTTYLIIGGTAIGVVLLLVIIIIILARRR